MSSFASAPSSGRDIVDLVTYQPIQYVDHSFDSVYAGHGSSGLSSSPLNHPSTPSAFVDIATWAYTLESPDIVCPAWSAVDFLSSSTGLRPSSVEPAWPCTLATAPTPGGGLESLCVGWDSDDSTSFPSESFQLPGDALATCALMTYHSVPPPYCEERYGCWDVPCHLQTS